MANEPQMTIFGNLTADPELRFTPSGVAVANFDVAVTPRVKDGDSFKDGNTSFFRCTVWRDYAEHVAESLKKGNTVFVSGRFATSDYTTKAGETRTSLEIAVEECGPTLRWATTTVTKVGSTSGGGRPSSAPAQRTSSFGDEPPF